MWFAEWLRPPRRTLAVFLGLMLFFGGALTWIGKQLLDQDRSLERQRTQERLEQSADYIAAELQRSLSGLERYLDYIPGPSAQELPTGVMALQATQGAVGVRPADRLLFYPAMPAGEPERSAPFAEGENMEYRRKDPVAAAEIYRVMAKSPDPDVRAGALLRLGRNLRKTGRYQEALQVYDKLGRLGSVRLLGLPSELVAHEARCSVLESIGRCEELRQEASLMHSALFSGRWSLLRPAWEFYVEEARRWSGARPVTEDEQNSLVLSYAAAWTYGHWLAELESSGRQILRIDERPVLISWTASSDTLTAVLADPGYLDSMWSEALRGRRVKGGLVDEGGRRMMGSFDGKAQQAIRTSVATGLPWTLHVASADPSADLAAFAVRRRILLSGFAVLVLVLSAGSYFILRSICRERAVARLQSEFVSAVTHEFRTPLTSLRQLSEMLSKGRVPTEELRQQSYDILARESQRLQRLVESLLDFGRIEARAVQYHFQGLDPKTLVRDVVAEFQEHVANEGYRIELAGADEYPPIHADREALGLALWNLLDNAVKYSPDCRIVRVQMALSHDRLAIHVHDRGMGIPEAEQKEIFNKFVRGTGSRNANIKGTGIGLAMVRHIIEAHNGEIRLESETGRGSTFTILLPLERTT
jgi:signal transduction histidine kinase